MTDRVTLTEAQMALAERLALQWSQRVQARQLPQTRYDHTPDKGYQNLLGAVGEVGFRLLLGISVDVSDMAGTWKGADVLGYALKSVSRSYYKLIFDDSDLSPDVHMLVRLIVESRVVRLGGQIDVESARRVRFWDTSLPRPTWAIRPSDLKPFILAKEQEPLW
jgi:hypothetical protein